MKILFDDYCDQSDHSYHNHGTTKICGKCSRSTDAHNDL